MYPKGSTDGVTVEKVQMDTLTKAGWTMKPAEVKKEAPKPVPKPTPKVAK